MKSMRSLYKKLFHYVPDKRILAYFSMALSAAAVCSYMGAYWFLWQSIVSILVIPVYEKAMHGFRMAKNMRRDFGRHPRGSFPCHICIFLDDVCNSRTGQFVPASIPKQGHIWVSSQINVVFLKVTT